MSDFWRFELVKLIAFSIAIIMAFYWRYKFYKALKRADTPTAVLPERHKDRDYWAEFYLMRANLSVQIAHEAYEFADAMVKEQSDKLPPTTREPSGHPSV